MAPYERFPVEPILDFLSGVSKPRGLIGDRHGDPVRRYIEERRDDELAEWDVLFASVGERGGNVTDTSLGRKIRCQREPRVTRVTRGRYWLASRQRVSTRGIERTGLTNEQRALAEREYRDRDASGERWQFDGGQKFNSIPRLGIQKDEDEAPPNDPPD